MSVCFPFNRLNYYTTNSTHQIQLLFNNCPDAFMKINIFIFQQTSLIIFCCFSTNIHVFTIYQIFLNKCYQQIQLSLNKCPCDFHSLDIPQQMSLCILFNRFSYSSTSVLVFFSFQSIKLFHNKCPCFFNRFSYPSANVHVISTQQIQIFSTLNFFIIFSQQIFEFLSNLAVSQQAPSYFPLKRFIVPQYVSMLYAELM